MEGIAIKPRYEKVEPIGVVAVLALCGLVAVGFIAECAAADESKAETWCGLVVEPEHRCSDYNRDRDYDHDVSGIEWRIAERAGYGLDEELCGGEPKSRCAWLDRPFPSPYMPGVRVRSLRDTDIEHIVAAAEAHDSGLCRADRATRTAFARDLDNLTLALPSVNRYEKVDKDPAEWLPKKRVRWYVGTWVAVKRKHGLSVDRAERDALAAVFGKGGCKVDADERGVPQKP